MHYRFNLISLLLVFTCSIALNGCLVLLPFVEENEPNVHGSDIPISRPISKSSYWKGSYSRRSGSENTNRQVKMYIAQLKHQEPAVRTRAASSLGFMGASANNAIKPLIFALNDESKNVRRAAVKSLGKLQAVEAIEPLKLRLKDKDPFVAHSAANALKMISK